MDGTRFASMRRRRTPATGRTALAKAGGKMGAGPAEADVKAAVIKNVLEIERSGRLEFCPFAEVLFLFCFGLGARFGAAPSAF